MSGQNKWREFLLFTLKIDIEVSLQVEAEVWVLHAYQNKVRAKQSTEAPNAHDPDEHLRLGRTTG